MAKKKERLDKLLVERGLVETRAKGQALIMAGEVLVDGERSTKAGMQIPVEAEIELLEPLPYVGRGGYKLAGALEVFDIGVEGRICADVGACTGGFTDVLLQGGAARVFAIDVGYGQLDWKLRQDERVTIMERTNARYLEVLEELVDFVCIDVSFISLKLILPAVRGWLANSADLVVLIKPQFEAGRDQVGKGGIVRDSAVHKEVLKDILLWSEKNHFRPLGLIRSPIEGAGGNAEFLAWLRWDGIMGEAAVSVERLIETVLKNS